MNLSDIDTLCLVRFFFSLYPLLFCNILFCSIACFIFHLTTPLPLLKSITVVESIYIKWSEDSLFWHSYCHVWSQVSISKINNLSRWFSLTVIADFFVIRACRLILSCVSRFVYISFVCFLTSFVLIASQHVQHLVIFNNIKFIVTCDATNIDQ